MNWYNVSCFDNVSLSTIDFGEIANEIGRSTRACQVKLSVIVGAEVLTKDAINFMIDRL